MFYHLLTFLSSGPVSRTDYCLKKKKGGGDTYELFTLKGGETKGHKKHFMVACCGHWQC